MRRTRYTFIAQHDRKTNGEPRQIDVLDYSVEDAFDLLERRGYYNIERIRKTVTRRPHGGWQIDPAKLREARDFLGLRWPVRIRQNARSGSTNGNYRVGDAHGAPFHNIMLKSYLPPEQVSKTLWHELTHALQAERAAAACGARWGRECQDAFQGVIAQDRGVYRAKKIEREARENEKWAEALPLIK